MSPILAFIPPLPFLLKGKIIQALIACLLTICVYFPGLIYALLFIQNSNADSRNKKLIKAIEKK